MHANRCSLDLVAKDIEGCSDSISLVGSLLAWNGSSLRLVLLLLLLVVHSEWGGRLLGLAAKSALSVLRTVVTAIATSEGET